MAPFSEGVEGTWKETHIGIYLLREESEGREKIWEESFSITSFSAEFLSIQLNSTSFYLIRI